MKLDILFNLIALILSTIIIITAFYLQLTVPELPCAMCNLERAGYLIFGIGLLLNMKYSVSNTNYMISGFGAFFASLTALIQMFVHVLPGTPPTGTTIFGLHLYPWGYITLTLAFVFCFLMIGLPSLKNVNSPIKIEEKTQKKLINFIGTVFIILSFAQFLSVFLENGFYPMKAGGQQHYQMLYNGDVMKP